MLGLDSLGLCAGGCSAGSVGLRVTVPLSVKSLAGGRVMTWFCALVAGAACPASAGEAAIDKPIDAAKIARAFT